MASPTDGFGRTPGVGDGQGGQGCCGSWDRKDSDTTERLNWNCVCAHSVAHLCPTMGRQLYKTGIKEQKKFIIYMYGGPPW